MNRLLRREQANLRRAYSGMRCVDRLFVGRSQLRQKPMRSSSTFAPNGMASDPRHFRHPTDHRFELGATMRFLDLDS